MTDVAGAVYALAAAGLVCFGALVAWLAGKDERRDAARRRHAQHPLRQRQVDVEADESHRWFWNH